MGEQGSTDHQQSQDNADNRGKGAQKDQDTADDFQEGDNRGSEIRGRDVQTLEESRDIVDARHVELLPPVGDEDDSQDEAGHEQRNALEGGHNY
ncbi:hypothetical protein KaCgl_10390 [Corynebacterium glutamicum]|nr:hypothetical protein KaCgl_10390 [Corynebacterium glutamicum]